MAVPRKEFHEVWVTVLKVFLTEEIKKQQENKEEQNAEGDEIIVNYQKALEKISIKPSANLGDIEAIFDIKQKTFLTNLSTALHSKLGLAKKANNNFDWDTLRKYHLDLFKTKSERISINSQLYKHLLSYIENEVRYSFSNEYAQSATTIINENFWKYAFFASIFLFTSAGIAYWQYNKPDIFSPQYIFSNNHEDLTELVGTWYSFNCSNEPKSLLEKKEKECIAPFDKIKWMFEKSGDANSLKIIRGFEGTSANTTGNGYATYIDSRLYISLNMFSNKKLLGIRSFICDKVSTGVDKSKLGTDSTKLTFECVCTLFNTDKGKITGIYAGREILQFNSEKITDFKEMKTGVLAKLNDDIEPFFTMKDRGYILPHAK